MDMGRSTFMAVAAMAAAGCAVGGGRTGAQFVGWTKGHFQIHFTYTGASESMFLIFPDGTTMLIDCGDFDATVLGGRHFLSLYTGTKTDTTVLVIQTLENVR